MKKPIVLVIMDGVGRGDGGPGDAVKQANTPTLDKLMATIEAGLKEISDEAHPVESVSLRKLREMKQRLASGYTSFWS